MCNGVCVDIKTDKANCGGCGKVCSALSPSTAECTPTGCLVTLAQGIDISGLAVDATHVYWTDVNGGKSGSVGKVPVGGGIVTTLATDQAFPNSIVVNATHAFWASVNEEAIRRVPIAGGATTTLASSVNGACCLALNSTHLYYLSNLGVNRMPLAGGDPSVFAPADEGFAVALALTATHVFWRADLPGTGSIKAKIMKKSLVDGTSPTALIMSTSVGNLVADSGSVYWTSPGNLGGSVMSVPLTGGTAMVLASDLGQPGSLALDTTHLYWTNGTGARVMKLPIMGGTPTVLASGPKQIGVITVDANSVYWVYLNGAANALMKLTPK
jgi:hypothetical protein